MCSVPDSARWQFRAAPAGLCTLLVDAHPDVPDTASCLLRDVDRSVFRPTLNGHDRFVVYDGSFLESMVCDVPRLEHVNVRRSSSVFGHRPCHIRPLGVVMRASGLLGLSPRCHSCLDQQYARHVVDECPSLGFNDSGFPPLEIVNVL